MVRYARARFTAIAVGQGDAFYLERGRHSALIDGGRSVEGIADRFRAATGRGSIEVLVCTHSDADHANGVLGILQSGIVCNEVWLPAIWGNQLEDILRDPARSAEEVADNISHLSPHLVEVMMGKESSPLTALGDYLAEHNGEWEIEWEPSDMESSTDTHLLDESENMHPRNEPNSIFSDYFILEPGIYSNPIWYWLRHSPLPQEIAVKLFWEALAVSRTIRQIVTVAHENGCTIRWFKYERGRPASGGIPGFLVPVNAREVARLPVRRLPISTRLLFSLALSMINRESLVFLSEGTVKTPPVLFTADSNLDFGHAIPWRDGMIITTPHHGSEANKKVYIRHAVEGGGISAIWVRSDCRSRSRPGLSFLNLPRENRVCTLCRGATEPRQDVKLHVVKGRWQKQSRIRSCSCI